MAESLEELAQERKELTVEEIDKLAKERSAFEYSRLECTRECNSNAANQMLRRKAELVEGLTGKGIPPNVTTTYYFDTRRLLSGELKPIEYTGWIIDQVIITGASVHSETKFSPGSREDARDYNSDGAGNSSRMHKAESVGRYSKRRGIAIGTELDIFEWQLYSQAAAGLVINYSLDEQMSTPYEASLSAKARAHGSSELPELARHVAMGAPDRQVDKWASIIDERMVTWKIFAEARHGST